MFRDLLQPDGQSPVERLRKNRQRGSDAHDPNTDAFEEPAAIIQSAPLRSNPVFHPIAWMLEMWVEAIIERKRHKNLYASQANRDEYLDDKKTASYKHGVDQQQVVVDAKSNEAAQSTLRRLGVGDYGRAMNCADRVSSRMNRSLKLLDTIEDKEVQDKARSVYQFMYEEVMDAIQMISCDREMQQDGEGGKH